MKRHRYALELYRIVRFKGEDVEREIPLGQRPVAERAWGPGLQWLILEAMRRGVPVDEMAAGALRFDPVFAVSEADGRCRAVRTALELPGGRIVAGTVLAAALGQLAQEYSVWFVQRGLLLQGEVFRFRLLAFEDGFGAVHPGAIPKCLLPYDLVIEERGLEDLAGMGREEGVTPSAIPPVVVAEEVLQGAMGASAGSAVECGGLLSGHLRRDSSDPSLLFVEVTRRIHVPARGDVASLRFTPEAWSFARDALRREGAAGEVFVGWYHYHPRAVLSQCEAGEASDGTTVFFSAKDVDVHRATFPRAYSVALVVGEGKETGLKCAMFGWLPGGVVGSRGFRAVETQGVRS